MLDEYEVSKDEERIKRMYSEEIERAKENMNNNRMIKNNDDFELHDEEGDGREYSSDSDTESVENSFIVNDDDEIEEEKENDEESSIDVMRKEKIYEKCEEEFSKKDDKDDMDELIDELLK